MVLSLRTRWSSVVRSTLRADFDHVGFAAREGEAGRCDRCQAPWVDRDHGLGLRIASNAICVSSTFHVAALELARIGGECVARRRPSSAWAWTPFLGPLLLGVTAADLDRGCGCRRGRALPVPFWRKSFAGGAGHLAAAACWSRLLPVGVVHHYGLLEQGAALRNSPSRLCLVNLEVSTTGLNTGTSSSLLGDPVSFVTRLESDLRGLSHLGREASPAEKEPAVWSR